MLLTDYFRSEKDAAWDIAKQCGVAHGVIRLPEDGKFDYADCSHWKSLCDKFNSFGVKPVIIEPMPNELHEHIKRGDDKRDECIEKVIKMLPNMGAMGIETICFNWMPYIGWYRNQTIIERGGAKVTGFSLKDLELPKDSISEEMLWENYEYFLKAVIPYAERYNIKLALHPDDPPRSLGNVSRIMTSFENIDKAINRIVPSKNLGVTMCQATYHIMGEDLKKVISFFAEKIFFIHFRNTTGNLDNYRETFHDNGEINMADILKHYYNCGINVPIRVDHVPTLVGEDSTLAGYDALGRLFAIGYLKGLLEATERGIL